MDKQKILKGKWILVVDDEEDILQLVYELLEMCKIDTASSYEEAKELLGERSFDFVIVAFALFLVIRQMNKLRKPAPAATPTTKECPYCFTMIPIPATRCPHCTSQLEEEGGA